MNDEDHDARIRLKVLEAIIVEAARSGGLTREVVNRVADRLDDEASGITRGDRRDVATWAMVLALDVHGQTQQERDAEFRRKQIRERTAILARDAERDGGNEGG